MPAYSLNAPVPSEVARLAAGLASECLTADAREHHSVVVKRLGGNDDYRRGLPRIREALADADPVAVRAAGVEAFRQPTTGRGPVAYLAVESPGLGDLHERCCEVVDPFPGLEGAEYVPHVTIARGGDADRLVGREAGPVEWVVDRLEVWDAERRTATESVSLG